MHDALVYELHLHVDSPEHIELLIGICSFLDVEALEEREDSIIIYSEDQTYINQLKDQLTSHAPWLTLDKIEVKQQKNENWNQLWELSFQPIIINDFCIIKSSHHSIDETAEHTIIIDPEMAFGTGHHETTYMMIEQMRKIDFSHQQVLDYGSGTAILSILAEKLGASKVLAIDYDDNATSCALKCLDQNSSNHVTCKTGTIDDVSLTTLYDIILANINRNVLLSTAEDVYARHATSGHLLLSGILDTDKDLIVEKYTSVGYKVADVSQRGEWLCMHLRKR